MSGSNNKKGVTVAGCEETESKVVEIRVHNHFDMNEADERKSVKSLHERMMNAKPSKMTESERRKLKRQIMLKELDAEIEKIKRLAASI